MCDHLDTSVSPNVLASKTIFTMHCKYSSVYLTMKKPSISKAPKSRAKSKILAAKVLGELLRLPKLKDLDLDKVQEVDVGLALAKQDLIAIILLKKQDSLKMNNLKAMHYQKNLADPLRFT